MSAYEPGTVAVATVRGVEGVRVFRTGSPALGKWITAESILPKTLWLDHSEVTDIRPLAVLDMTGIAPEAIVKALRDKDAGTNGTGWARVAEQIEEQSKPPRIPEPGLWGVVEAQVSKSGKRTEFIRTKHGWLSNLSLSDYAWDSLIDPTLIREGVQS